MELWNDIPQQVWMVYGGIGVLTIVIDYYGL